MDLEEALLKEHSKKQCKVITDYIGNDASPFAELMKIFFRGDYRLSQRAAWAMSNLVLDHPATDNPLS